MTFNPNYSLINLHVEYKTNLDEDFLSYHKNDDVSADEAGWHD